VRSVGVKAFMRRA